MDHAGAVFGPLLAAVLLASGAALGDVFLWSVVPGMLVLLLLVFGLPAAARAERPMAQAPLRWPGLDRRLRRLVVAAGLLALASVPEVCAIWERCGAGSAFVAAAVVTAAAAAWMSAVARPPHQGAGL